MAKQIIERLIDDLDGGEATQTVLFSYAGVEYTIDLSDSNATKMRNALNPYVTNGTKVKTTWHSQPQRRAGTPYITSLSERKRIREWAAGTGKWPDLSDRGRIPDDVIAAYRATGQR